ncbi:hypothetical protein CHS0354_027472, partial [Potamilus streckersoni]
MPTLTQNTSDTSAKCTNDLKLQKSSRGFGSDQIPKFKNLKKKGEGGFIKLHKADTEYWSQKILKTAPHCIARTSKYKLFLPLQSSQYTPKTTNKHYIPTLYFLYCRLNGKRQWKSTNNAYTNKKDVRNKRSTSQEVDIDSTDSKTCSSNKSSGVLGIDQVPKGLQNCTGDNTSACPRRR